ncbi:MAG: threonine synthase [Gemmatimonadetes bacterium]|nr:threonine synthase [Gemmatimonadota bacterium]NNM06173.1 threonine synthase [Gemmatimonadota bacterium]
MEFISTRGVSTPVPLRDAVFQGLASDGGLFMPLTLPSFDVDTLTGMQGESWPELAFRVLGAFLEGSLADKTVTALVGETLNFPVPLVQLSERIHVLELFHGPTLAFKDVGARFMASLLAHYRDPEGPTMTVLTATSGDTGGAVAKALHGLENVRVVVLFPDGRVTPRQERQFSTLGGNVLALAVKGDFDDCQRLAKEAFRADRGTGAKTGSLTSANSINVARFLPQTTYFFKAWRDFEACRSNRTRILFSVPSGNFGNLAAGMTAKAAGMPGASFLAATNANDVVPEYLHTGVFSPRPSVTTVSTAMDVGNPSNLDRILHLYGKDMDSLAQDLVGQRVTDEETLSCIRRTYRDTGYVLDPHTAVGLAALEKRMEPRSDQTGIVLATAHPAKFAGVVEPAIGTEMPIPPELAGCLEGKRQVTPIEPRLEALQEILEA